MPHLLIVESNLTEVVNDAKNNGRLSAGETYSRALQASACNVNFDICIPCAEDFNLNQIDFNLNDGFVFTGSNVAWRVDDVKASILR